MRHREARTPVQVHTVDGAGSCSDLAPPGAASPREQLSWATEEPGSGMWGKALLPGVPTACGCHS